MRKMLFVAMAFFCIPLFAQQETIKFSVSFVGDTGDIRSLNGVQGGPLSTNSHDANLTEHFIKSGVNFVRFPYGDGFNDGFQSKAKEGEAILKTLSKLTLSDIFPNKDADPNNESSYDFSDLDKYVKAIKKSGAEPVWQAIYDIGKGGVTWLENGREAGKAPFDVVKWNTVVANVLRHLNNGWAKGGRWGVKYVEFYHDSAGLGGYDFRFDDKNVRPLAFEDTKPGRAQFMNNFVEFIRTIEKYNNNYNGNVKVVGPGLDAEHTLKYIPEIMTKLSALKINPEILIFSYRDYNSPGKLLENASFIRREIDRMVLGNYRGMPIWNVEWNAFALFPPSIQNKKDTGTDEVSAWIMAHNIQTKTLVQPYWNEAMVFRANRAAMNKITEKPADSFYFNLDSKGEVRPAYLGWLAMDKIAKETPIRLKVQQERKDSLVTVLAAKSQNGRKLQLLVSFWKETADGISTSIRYSIDVANFRQRAGSTGRLYVIDKNSKALEVKKEISSDKSGGASFSISEDISLWSVHLLEFEK